MLYTLIIVTVIQGFDFRSGGGIDVHSVPGFTTEQACLNAAKEVKLPAQDSKYFTYKSTTACVPNTI